MADLWCESCGRALLWEEGEYVCPCGQDGWNCDCDPEEDYEGFRST